MCSAPSQLQRSGGQFGLEAWQFCVHQSSLTTGESAWHCPDGVGAGPGDGVGGVGGGEGGGGGGGVAVELRTQRKCCGPSGPTIITFPLLLKSRVYGSGRSGGPEGSDVQNNIGGVPGNLSASIEGYLSPPTTIDVNSARVGNLQPPPSKSMLAQNFPAVLLSTQVASQGSFSC